MGFCFLSILINALYACIFGRNICIYKFLLVHHAMKSALPTFVAMGVHLAGDSFNLGLQRSSDPGLYQTDLVVMDTKLAIIEILQFLMNLRLDYRITKLLVAFKVNQENDDVSTPEMGAKLVDLAENLLQAE